MSEGRPSPAGTSWWIAIGSALRGRWRDALRNFYERMTDLCSLWRAVIKPVLEFLARLFPGCEAKLPRLEPPPPWPPQWQPKKHKDTDTPEET